MNEAKQLYMEQYGEALVTGSYLKIAVALLVLAVAGLVVLNLKTIHTFRNFKPLVIRIDELGRAQALSYDSFAYKPEAKEAKYFLTQFCEIYYRRNRYTINDDFTKAMYFLDGTLANDIMAADQKNKVVETFLDNPSAPEVDIDVQQVAIEPMIKSPYRASVDFYKIEYSPVDHSVLKKTLCTASFVFEFRKNVPNQLIPINPLGLTITYFREDEAFNLTKTGEHRCPSFNHRPRHQRRSRLASDLRKINSPRSGGTARLSEPEIFRTSFRKASIGSTSWTRNTRLGSKHIQILRLRRSPGVTARCTTHQKLSPARQRRRLWPQRTRRALPSEPEV